MLNIDFSPGKIIYDGFTFNLSLPLDKTNLELDEDMLHVSYPNDIVLDVSWKMNFYKFVIVILQVGKTGPWNDYLFIKSCSSIAELQEILQQCAEQIRLLLSHKILGDIDFSPGDVQWDYFDFDPALPLNKTNPYLVRNMLNVRFKNKIFLDIAWEEQEELFVITITEGCESEHRENPLARQVCATLDEIKEALREYIPGIKKITHPPRYMNVNQTTE